MHQVGLNSSIVEQVSAIFENGNISKGIVTGEVALTYHPADASSPAKAFDTAQGLRLENFAALEKVAPNPAFVTPIPDRNGEYFVNLAHLSRPTVAFKYQVHLDDSALTQHCPLMLSPAWKIEPKQASVIMQYSLNPAFANGAVIAITLKDVYLVINLQSARATSCRVKPDKGTFSRERSLVWWHFPEVTVRAGASPEKVLARFMTESEAQPGTVQARWEVQAEESHGWTLGSGLWLSHMGASGGAVPDPFADEGLAGVKEGSGKKVATVRTLASGKYLAVPK
jgi:hypothetical protein